MTSRGWRALAGALFCAATAVVDGQQAEPASTQVTVAREFERHGIIGYADRMSVRAGETIQFMVSSQLPAYQASIVRLIHGDPNAEGPGIKEVIVEAFGNRTRPGRKQEIPFGSHVTVADHPALRFGRSFTLTAWIAATTPGRVAHEKAAAGIMSKWSSADGGYALVVDDEGRLALWLKDTAGTVEKHHLDVPLRAWAPIIPGGTRPRPHAVPTIWYFVAASYDASSGTVRLVQDPVTPFPGDPTRLSAERPSAIRALATPAVPFVIAGYASGSTRAPVAGLFNGKIDTPRVYGRPLSAEEIASAAADKPPSDVVAAWDFAADPGSSRVPDLGPSRLHGVTANVPMRAVTGHNWRQAEMNFTHAPAEFNAAYFHDDDLEDAKWDLGFSFAVPPGLKSGVYAARLRTTTSEDYVPFVVRPANNGPRQRIAFLVPTFSYLAYASAGGSGFRPLSAYSAHNDGSGVAYVSHLRPITNMRPKISTNRPWQFMADTHITDWLEAKGFQYDAISDHDLHREGAALLASYKVVITGTHPEYYSEQMLNGMAAYLGGGGRVMYMGGNGFYWVTTLDPGGRYIELRRRDGTEAWQGAPGEGYHSTTGEAGGLWRFRGRAPQMLFGVGFTAQGFDVNSPFRRMPGSYDPRAAFIFEGIGKDELIGTHPSLVLKVGAAGVELDRVDYALGSPAHTLILATSFGHSDDYQHVVEELNTSDSRQGGTVNPLVKADMAYLEYPNGGAVFSTASIGWSGSLFYNNYTNNVSRITENVLRRFSADEPIPFPRLPAAPHAEGASSARTP
jgi:N,N-dimethylformamidase